MHHNEKTDKKYWDNIWKNKSIPKVFNPHRKGIAAFYKDYVPRQFHKLFSKYIKHDKQNLLEVGCAASIWVGYFVNEFNLKVVGIDNSEIGCEITKKMLTEEGQRRVEIYCCDLFKPPQKLIGRFDVVFSFGVVEHFENTAHCIKHLRDFLREGGTIITIIPNLIGLLGTIQKKVDKDVFNKHLALDKDQLKQAHEANWLEIIHSDYFCFWNVSMVNFSKLAQQKPKIWKLLKLCLTGLNCMFWTLEYLAPAIFPPNRLTSPYIVVVAKKK